MRLLLCVYVCIYVCLRHIRQNGKWPKTDPRTPTAPHSATPRIDEHFAGYILSPQNLFVAESFNIVPHMCVCVCSCVHNCIVFDFSFSNIQQKAFFMQMHMHTLYISVDVCMYVRIRLPYWLPKF